MSRLNSYKIEPFGDALVAWPQSHIDEIVVSGLGPAKQVAMNVLLDDEDWNHTVSWHIVDGAWELCVETRWNSHNAIARVSKIEASR